MSSANTLESGASPERKFGLWTSAKWRVIVTLATLVLVGVGVAAFAVVTDTGHERHRAPKTGLTEASRSTRVAASIVGAALAYYRGEDLIPASEIVECEPYGASARILPGYGVGQSVFIPKGTQVYDCVPRRDTSITGCFAILNGVAYDEDLSQPETCGGQEPSPSLQGLYLPPTSYNIERLVEYNWNLTQSDNQEPQADFTGVSFSIEPLTSIQLLPSDELDTNLSHWFWVQFNLNGSTYDEVANPWTHEVYESSATVATGG